MKNTTLICALCLFASGIKGQNVLLDTLVHRFDAYRQHAMQEKMYAHTDRNFYLTGETLWFKVYAVDGTLHKPLDISSVAYVEILDRADFPVLQAKIELKDGHGNGSFFLPASLNSGHYKFRVYSNWMKNFPAEFFFRQEITIVNPFVVPEGVTGGSNGPRYSIDFFPEGGNLLTGIKSKIGFKISGIPAGVSTTGFIIDNHGDTLKRFTPGKFGIGCFFFTAADSETYRVVLTDDHGRQSLHPFPPATSSGFALALIDTAQFIAVDVQATGVSDPDVFLFVQARQITVCAYHKSLKDDRATFLVPKSALPPGISQFTVFDAHLQPVAERLHFIYPEKKLAIQLHSDQERYGQRRKVTIDILTSDSKQAAVPANLSVAVYKADSLADDPPGIYEYLWLGSDVAKAIDSPGYYFNDSNPHMAQAMDNLMLTLKWRRFKWQDILDNHLQFAFVPEVHGHIISAQVTGGKKHEPGVFVYMGSPGKIVRAYGAWSNVSGEVQFEIKDFYGLRKIILQAKNDTTGTYRIQVNNPFSAASDHEKPEALELNERLKEALTSRSVAMQVQDIYYYDTYGNRFADPEVDSSAFYGTADATYYLDDYTRFPVMEEVMREYVAEVFVRKRKDGFHFLIINGVNKGVLNGDPMLLLDGVPVMDVDEIMQLDPLRIKKIDVIQRQYLLGQAVFPGIVSFATYDGDLAGWQPDAHSLSLDYEGLQLERKFYSPSYDYLARKDRLPDQRYLLYWNAEVTTGDDGRQHIEFYTSDVGGNYRVVVQGINAQGLAGSKDITFTVDDGENQ